MGLRSTTAAGSRVAAVRPHAGRPGAERHGPAHREVHRQGPSLPPTTPKVRVPELVLGVLLVAGCALGVLVWHRSATATHQVLVLARPVARGQLLTAADFAPAEVAGNGMALVAYDERARFGGRFAATDLAAGIPLTDSLALAATPLPEGEALIGRRLTPGQFPTGLAAGDAVVVVLVGEQPALITGTGSIGEAGQDASAAPPTGSSGPGEPSIGVDEAIAVTPFAVGSPAAGDRFEATPAYVEMATVESVTPAATSEAIDVTLRAADGIAARIAAADDVRLVQVGN